MSLSLEQDLLFLNKCLHQEEERRCLHQERVQGRRRTVSTSFEQGRQDKAFSEQRKTKSFSKDVVSLPKRLGRKQPTISSITEEKEEDESHNKKQAEKDILQNDANPEIGDSGLWGRLVWRLNSLPGLGIFICILNVLIFQLSNVITKQTELDPFLMLLFRDLLLTPMIMPPLIHCRQSPFPKGKRTVLVFNSAVNGFNMAAHFYAVKVLPLGDVVMIAAIKPVFVNMFSCLFLKEKCGIFEVVNLLLVISGIVLVIQPPLLFGQGSSEYTDIMFYAALAYLTTNIIGSTTFIVLRHLRTVNWSVITSANRVFAIAELVVLCTYRVSFCLPSCTSDRLNLFILSLVGFANSMLFATCFRYEEAHILGLVDNASHILVAQILQMLFFHILPSLLKSVGICLVLSSVIFIGGKKIWEHKIISRNTIELTSFSDKK